MQAAALNVKKMYKYPVAVYKLVPEVHELH